MTATDLIQLVNYYEDAEFKLASDIYYIHEQEALKADYQAFKDFCKDAGLFWDLDDDE